MVKVKICGIRSLEDAIAVADAGADAVGFILSSKGPRAIAIDDARKICLKLPPFITKVGVFVDEEADFINAAVDEAGLDVVQLHGSESPLYCESIDRPVIKAIMVSGPEVTVEMNKYSVSAFLLDSYRKGKYGGTGSTFDWTIARIAADNFRVIVAGGLTPENVSNAVYTSLPYGVDVSSGVEDTPGVKNVFKVRKFIERVRESRRDNDHD